MSGDSPTALARPELLRWARRSIGLEAHVAAGKAKVSVASLESWESGDAAPSVDELRRLAGVYRRPLAAFYLPRTPSDFDVMRDFRRLPGASSAAWTPELHTEFRRALDQREVVLELLDLLEEDPPHAWAIPPGNSLDDTAANIRTAVLRSAVGRSASRNKYERLTCWTSGIEALGVLVITVREVAVAEMRGFSILRDRVPIIAVNGKDAPNGRVFSALHEMAHLVLKTSGLCDQHVGEAGPMADRLLETQCNAIAGRVLMPQSAVLGLAAVQTRPPEFEDWSDEALASITDAFGVSREAALRRLLDLGRTTERHYQQRRAEWLSELADRPEQTEGSPTFYEIHPTTMGKGFVRLVDRARRAGAITGYEAASYLRARVGQIERLAAIAGGGAQ